MVTKLFKVSLALWEALDMRLLLRTLVVALLISSLVEAPVFASPEPSRALGVILQAERARLSSGDAVNGATVFDGDTLATYPAGALRARVGETQLHLLADSRARMRQAAGGATAVLERGTVILSSAAAGAVNLQASAARIHPRTAQILAQVTLVNPQELLVTSNRGSLEVTVGDEIHTVAENTSYRVLIEPEVPNPQGGPVKAARSRFIVIALILIAIGTGIGIWRATVSDDKP